MDKNIQLLTALLSAVVGGAIAIGGGYLTNRLNRKQQQLDLLRSRGEELYSLVVRWINGLGASSLRRGMVMQGKLTYDQCHDLDAKDEAFDFARIELLIDVYFPAARKAYDSVVFARSRLNKLETAFKLAYEQGEHTGPSTLPSYVAAMKAIDDSGECLKAALRATVRSIGA